MKKFILKYIDAKKLVTGLLEVVIVGLFWAIWNNFSQLVDKLSPILTYSINVPVLPTIVLLIFTQYIIHKGLLRFQIKFGAKKSTLIQKWLVRTNRSTPQWTDYREIGLNNGLLVSVKCLLDLKSDYLRFGFKLLDENAAIFGVKQILTKENNGLFHIGKEVKDEKMYITCYKNGIGDTNGIYAGNYILGQPIKLELKIDHSNILEFFVDGILYYSTGIKTEYRERLVLMAWGDGNEYEIDVNDIEVASKK